MSIKDGLYGSTSFTDFTMGLAIAAFILTMLNASVIWDEQKDGEKEGFLVSMLNECLIHCIRKINFLHLLILLVYMAVLSNSYFDEGLADQTTSKSLLVIALLNLLPPFAICCIMGYQLDNYKPSDIDYIMENKGVDITFSDAAQRVDFWYSSICAMIVIGASRLFDGNALALGMHDEKSEKMIE